jgi:hypothetical protein
MGFLRLCNQLVSTLHKVICEGELLIRCNNTMFFLFRCLVVCWFVVPTQAAELKPDTAAAFDRYIRATEAAMADDLRSGHFLCIDRLFDVSRQETYAKLRHGQLYIEQLHTKKEDGKSFQIPGGLVHHWVGVIFIPGARLSQVLAVLQDYDNHKNVYKPEVRRSKLLERNGSEFKVYLQFYRKSIVAVVINVDFDVHYTICSPTRALSQSYSTRVAEVENPDKPNERELPVGNDHGYVWRLDNYWRIEQKDNGVYVQVESVALSRSIPAIFAWLINPLVRNISRAVLSNLLNATCRAVTTAECAAGSIQPHNPSFESAIGLCIPCLVPEVHVYRFPVYDSGAFSNQALS